VKRVAILTFVALLAGCGGANKKPLTLYTSNGWTITLASLPQTGGRRAAVERARDARRHDLGTVGILDSSQYASLHPGYWIVFTGEFASEAEASSALPSARAFARTASVRRVVP